METNWKTLILAELDNQRSLLHKRDVSFYQLARFERAIEKIAEHAPQCDSCKKHQVELSEFVPDIAKHINGSAKQKRRYENEMEKLIKHLRLQHQVFPAYYQVYLITSKGFAIGLLVGFLLAFLFPAYFQPLWISSTIAGLVISYFVGNAKDMASRRKKKVI